MIVYPGQLVNCVMATSRKPVRSYQDLEVWQRAVDLVVEAYRITKSFPTEERYGLTAQIRRSAVSIPSNIAEGKGRQGLGGLLYHLYVANGSLLELETQFVLAIRLDYLQVDDSRTIFIKTGEVGRLLAGLLRALNARKGRQPIPDTRYPVPRPEARRTRPFAVPGGI
jgi:four helix bundle protein